MRRVIIKYSSTYTSLISFVFCLAYKIQGCLTLCYIKKICVIIKNIDLLQYLQFFR
jgi:hypothetical protein